MYLFILTDPKFKTFQFWCFLSLRNVSLHHAPRWDGHSSFPTAHTKTNWCSRPWMEWYFLHSQKLSLDHLKDSANTMQIVIVLYCLETNAEKNMLAAYWRCNLKLPLRTQNHWYQWAALCVCWRNIKGKQKVNKDKCTSWHHHTITIKLLALNGK